MSFYSKISIAIAAVFLAGCDDDPGKPVIENVGSTLKYFEAKQEFTEVIANAVAKQNNKYRIVAINGPQYRIGTALDPENPADLLSAACPVSEPASVPWTPIPASQRTRTIAFDSSLPSTITKNISFIDSAGIDFENERAGDFSLSEIAQRLSPQDDFNEALQSEACRAVTSGRDTVIVRGIIYAKEKFTNGRTLSGGVKVSALGADALVLRYDDNGSFEIEDANAIPRFHIITLLTAQEVDLGAGSVDIEDRLQAPSAAVVKRIEKAGL